MNRKRPGIPELPKTELPPEAEEWRRRGGLDPELPEAQSQPPALPTSKQKVGKSKDPDYQRSTVYLPKELHQKLKMEALKEGREISDVVEALVGEWLASKHSDV